MFNPVINIENKHPTVLTPPNMILSQEIRKTESLRKKLIFISFIHNFCWLLLSFLAYVYKYSKISSLEERVRKSFDQKMKRRSNRVNTILSVFWLMAVIVILALPSVAMRVVSVSSRGYDFSYHQNHCSKRYKASITHIAIYRLH